MIVSLIILGALLGVGAICYAHHRLTGGYKPGEEPKAAPDACCGQHLVCERTSLSPDMSAKPEYFDDEELDAFAGRPAEGYTPAEAEQFRDVLLTLRADEVPAWVRSVQQRGINLPEDVRDEMLMLVAEQRAAQ